MALSPRNIGWFFPSACLAPLMLAAIAAPPAGRENAAAATVHPALPRLLDETGGPVKAWIFFRDKGHSTPAETAAALERVAASYNPRAIQRRAARRTAPGLFDARDIPVAQRYIDAVAAAGARPHVKSRWLNAVSAFVTRAQLEPIARLPFVKALEPVRRGRRDMPAQPANTRLAGGALDGPGFYGRAEEQLTQINLIELHNAGFSAQGVIIGVLDTGFKRTHEAFNDPAHPLQIVAEWDFVNDDPNTSIEPGDDPDQHKHGTMILGTLGAYKPDELVGGAYDASFILCKTEDITDEYPGEEDNYVAGLEFIEANGGDMATASLIYIEWYTQGDLNGLTAVTTIGVNVATANGVHCCNAAGNMGHDADPNISHLGAPADAFQVITCGAVNSAGEIVSFSSDGPTADGRCKPEVLARGRNTWTLSPTIDNEYRTASGTSLSTPLVAGAVASLIQAQPTWTVDQLRNMLFQTAAYPGGSNGLCDPLYVQGYGIVNAYEALAQDCNANGVPDAEDIRSGTSPDVNNNGIPDECECLSDLNGDGQVDLADLGILLADFGCTAGPPPACPGDVDEDGDTDLGDLGILLAAFGSICP